MTGHFRYLIIAISRSKNDWDASVKICIGSSTAAQVTGFMCANQGRSQRGGEGAGGPCPPLSQSLTEWSFFTEKNWPCWDVWPALFCSLYQKSEVL